MKRTLLAMLAALSPFVTVDAAFAQRASENAVTAADDAFGTTVGNESIGIYNSFDVRGFSPLQAGNVRISGLYFDKVSDENDRIEESSRIRVGIAAQGYAFPAPTGIVDYALRTPGEAANLSTLIEGNNMGAYSLQLDGAVPLDQKLSLGGGAAFNRGFFPNGDNYEGDFGILAKWLPVANLEILPFWSRNDTYVQKDGEVYEPTGDFLPSPMPPRHFYGPEWARDRNSSVTYGTLVNYTLSSWVMRLGIFRSALDQSPQQLSLLQSQSERRGRDGRGFESAHPSGLDQRGIPAREKLYHRTLVAAPDPVAARAELEWRLWQLRHRGCGPPGDGPMGHLRQRPMSSSVPRSTIMSTNAGSASPINWRAKTGCR